MKHVFVVQSNFTYLAALGVVLECGLDLCDVIFISEGYTKEDPIKVNVIPTFWGFKKGGCSFRKYFSPVGVIGSHIEQLTLGETFTAYISVVTKLSRFVITSSKCVRYHFFEEGMSSYLVDYRLAALTAYNANEPFAGSSLWRRIMSCKLPLRGYSNRMSAIPIFYSGHLSINRKYYGFTEGSHPWAPTDGRVTMELERIANHFDLKSQYNLSGQIVWIGDCVDDNNVEEYLLAMEELFIKGELVAKGIKSIYLKFHYRAPKSNRNRTLALLSRYGIEVVIIDDATIMEVELLSCGDIKLYGTNSTLLFYGGICGHSSYSVERMYNSGHIEELVPIFWKYVNRL